MNTQSNHMTDVIIIGDGVVGASIALELQRSGRSVTVIDKVSETLPPGPATVAVTGYVPGVS